MKKATLAALLALSTCFGSAMAESIYLMGPDQGPPTCKNWVGDPSSKELYKAWLIGYLSGLAMGSGKDFLNKEEATTLAQWMDRYCAANPGDLTSVGALKLSRELRRTKGL
jgi:hypothetical protein